MFKKSTLLIITALSNYRTIFAFQPDVGVYSKDCGNLKDFLKVEDVPQAKESIEDEEGLDALWFNRFRIVYDSEAEWFDEVVDSTRKRRRRRRRRDINGDIIHSRQKRRALPDNDDYNDLENETLEQFEDENNTEEDIQNAESSEDILADEMEQLDEVVDTETNEDFMQINSENLPSDVAFMTCWDFDNPLTENNKILETYKDQVGLFKCISVGENERRWSKIWEIPSCQDFTGDDNVEESLEGGSGGSVFFGLFSFLIAVILLYIAYRYVQERSIL